MGRKICLATSNSFGASEYEQLKAFKRAGIDGFFTMYGSRGHIKEMRAAADELGLYFQSVHAEFHGMADFWKGGEAGDAVTENLIETVESAAEFNVPLIVMHAYIGFYTGEKPTALGLERFGKIVAVAEEKGIKIAVENTEGEEFLESMLDTYRSKNVGFCWDTGHELCYLTRKSVEKYNDRLFGTHIDETLVVLSKKIPDSHINIDVEFGEGEGQFSLKKIKERAEARKPKEKVTYKMIQEYIEKTYGFKVHTAYIAEVKRDLGLPMYDVPNAVEELKRPRAHPTPKMAKAIKETLKHFEII